jgi:hypothetical protein
VPRDRHVPVSPKRNVEVNFHAGAIWVSISNVRRQAI